MTVEDAKEANLWPLNVEVDLVLWLEDVQNDGNAVLIVIANDTLVGVRRVRFDDSTLLLARLGRLVVLELYCLGIQRRWVLSEEKRLHFNELNIGVTVLLARQRGRYLETLVVRILRRLAGTLTLHI